jgi:cobalt-zinc-cadmium efflux system protein
MRDIEPVSSISANHGLNKENFMSEHHDHSHAVVTEGNSKKLMFALGLTTT